MEDYCMECADFSKTPDVHGIRHIIVAATMKNIGQWSTGGVEAPGMSYALYQCPSCKRVEIRNG